MTSTDRPEIPGLDDPLTRALVCTRRFFTRAEISPDQRTMHKIGGREADAFYRDRWSHDKVVRSTHGVNCTGSCSWKVYVKDGIITWESQQTDYPSVGPDRPEYEPRGCPRGAAFSWYTYSPTRVRYPYVRGVLLEMYREAKARLGDPVLAWADIVGDPERARRYKAARGKGGLVRASWDEAIEIVAAAHVHTIKTWGPDRVAGFSPIPAMSMVSHAAGARFVNLIGGSMLSFYDWYADLPVASPQVFGDQTDVPESGDWWDAGYLIMWGSNLPVTRTPDAHWMTEARYRGQKVIAVAPDYADNVKFADEWLPARPGTDGALAMAMGHVVLKEFFVDRQVPYFTDYVKPLHRPAVPGPLEPSPRTRRVIRAGQVPHRRRPRRRRGGAARTPPSRRSCSTPAPASPSCRTARWASASATQGVGRWNLDLGDVDPLLSALTAATSRRSTVDLPRFDDPGGAGAILRRGVPVRRVGGHLVTTVFDLLLAQYGVAPGRPARRRGRPATTTPTSRTRRPGRSAITGVPAAAAARIGREFAANAEESRGRSMIIMGAGHEPLVPLRHHLPRVPDPDHADRLPGRQRRRLGALRRAGEGAARSPATPRCANAPRLVAPAAQMIQTAYWYLHTDQFRYDPFGADTLAVGHGRRAARRPDHRRRHRPVGAHGLDAVLPDVRPQPAGPRRRGRRAGLPVGEHVVDELKAGRLRFACEDPDAPENFPRVLTDLAGQPARLVGQGQRVLPQAPARHRPRRSAPPRRAGGLRPRDVVWRDEAPTGKLDLLLTLDFRMTSTTIFSDVVLPAATWYEKHDLNTTDMHPFVHSFNPAISPPWQTRTDWDAFLTISAALQRARRGPPRGAQGRRGRAAAARHPRRDGQARTASSPTGSAGECDPVPGVTMPKLVVVERDYGAVAAKMAALGPLLDTLGATTKGVTFQLDREVDYLRHKNGIVRGGVADGRPSLARDVHACEAILALSGTTNGHLATAGLRDAGGAAPASGWPTWRPSTRASRSPSPTPRVAPVPVITSPEWSGSEAGGRRYSPVHDQRRAAQALAHADRAAALLPRPRLDDRARRGAAGLPAAAEHARPVRRAGHRRDRRARA